MQTAVDTDQHQKSIILAEPEKIISKALTALIHSDPHYKIIEECSDVLSIVKLVMSLSPDILITSLHLDVKSGTEAIRSLRAAQTPTKILVLGSYSDETTIRMVLNAGADGYVSRADDPSELFTAMNVALSGERYVPVALTSKLSTLIECSTSESLRKNNDEFDPLAELSNREREVFYMLADGKPNRLIAKQLYISPRTVETHRARVIKKLGFTSTADLIKYAIRNNLTSCT